MNTLQKLLLCTPLLMVACQDPNQITHCPAPGAIYGHACNPETGAFINNAKVTITPKTPIGSCLSTQTVTADITGLYKFENVRAATYNVTYTSEDGKINDTRELVVTAGENSKKEWPECVPPTGVVKGRLCDARTGLWVDGGKVYVEIKAGELADTSSDGYFSLDVPQGQQTIHVVNKDYVKDYTINVVADSEQTIGETTCGPVEHGDVAGKICAYYNSEDDNYFLYGSTVFVEMGNFYKEAKTDADGNYTLTGIPVGSDIKVQVKHGLRHQATFNTPITANQLTTISEPQCIDTSNFKIAVITGTFDRFEKIVLPRLGFSVYKKYSSNSDREHGEIEDPNGNITILDGNNERWYIDEFLSQLAWMQEFDVIVIDSSDRQRIEASNAPNIELYLQNGGSLFITEHSYEIIRVTLPGYMSMQNNSKQNGANIGLAGHVSTNILNNDLKAALHGKTSFDAYLPNPDWSVMSELSLQPTKTEIIASGDSANTTIGMVNNIAMIVSFTPFEGGGKVLYTSIPTIDDDDTADTIDIDRYLFLQL